MDTDVGRDLLHHMYATWDPVMHDVVTRRHDMEQVDVAALISTLLGVDPPSSSFG